MARTDFPPRLQPVRDSSAWSSGRRIPGLFAMRPPRLRLRLCAAVVVACSLVYLLFHYAHVSESAHETNLDDHEWKHSRRKAVDRVEDAHAHSVLPRPRTHAPVPRVDSRGMFLPPGVTEYPHLVKGKLVAPNRIFHLDLKGAAPRASYFKPLFAFVKKMGATGLLIEWEDMFPYEGRLAETRHGNAYSVEQVREILTWARELDLTIIPLVQTFGHLEWILKLPQFIKYRQAERYPQVICIGDKEAVAVVEEALRQVIKVHLEFGMPFFHIGADEAFQVGMCEADQRLMREKLGNSRERLMLTHMAHIARSTRTLSANATRVLIWHDMLVNIPPTLIAQYELGSLVEPVVWNYAENLDEHLAPDLWTRLAVAFPFIWGASAFKGADGPNRYYSNVPHYLANHQSWLKQMTIAYKHFKQFRGIILTGWQRFDHFAVLCETLPVGLMSAAVNLALLRNAGLDATALKATSDAMNCASTVNVEMQGGVAAYCDFPGFKVYQSVQNLKQSLTVIEEQIYGDYQVRGWMSPFNIRQRYSQVWYLDQMRDRITMYANELQSIARNIRTSMEPIFFADTIDEFLVEYVQPEVDRLKQLQNDVLALSQMRTFERRPFAILPVGASPETKTGKTRK